MRTIQVGAFCLLTTLMAVAGTQAHERKNADLERALIHAKSQLTSGISYNDYSGLVADVNTEVELAERNHAVSKKLKSDLDMLVATMSITGQVWGLRFSAIGPAADSSFTYCNSDLGKLFQSTASTFKDEGLLDKELETTQLSDDMCAYYTDSAIGTLLHAVEVQADRTLNAI